MHVRDRCCVLALERHHNRSVGDGKEHHVALLFNIAYKLFEVRMGVLERESRDSVCRRSNDEEREQERGAEDGWVG